MGRLPFLLPPIRLPLIQTWMCEVRIDEGIDRIQCVPAHGDDGRNDTPGKVD